MRRIVLLCSVLILIAAVPAGQAAVSATGAHSADCAETIIEPTSVIVDIKPDTLSSESHGEWATCYITPAEGYSVHDFDVSSIYLEEVPALIERVGIVDIDLDGVYELMVKFDRDALLEKFTGFVGYVDMTVVGSFTDGTSFTGIDTVHVMCETADTETVRESETVTEPTSVIVDIKPDTLSSNSHGKWVTCYITPAEGYSVHDFDVSSIYLEGVPAFTERVGIVDIDLDGVYELMVKFDRDALLERFTGFADYVEMTVVGSLTDGTSFIGFDTVYVVSAPQNMFLIA